MAKKSDAQQRLDALARRVEELEEQNATLRKELQDGALPIDPSTACLMGVEAHVREKTAENGKDDEQRRPA